MRAFLLLFYLARNKNGSRFPR